MLTFHCSILSHAHFQSTSLISQRNPTRSICMLSTRRCRKPRWGEILAKWILIYNFQVLFITVLSFWWQPEWGLWYFINVFFFWSGFGCLTFNVFVFPAPLFSMKVSPSLVHPYVIIREMCILIKLIPSHSTVVM